MGARSVLLCCGAGGIRTLVQTGKQHAFYMLIPDFIFVHRQDPDHQPTPYSLKLHLNIETWTDYFRFTCTAGSRRFGTTSLGRCLVPSPGDGIKPVIYCTSIRQRERNCFRQLNCWPNGLWSLQPSLRMLTYHLDPLSNPVNPKL